MGWVKNLWSHDERGERDVRDLESSKVAAYLASVAVNKAAELLLTRVGELQREIQQEGGQR